MINIRLIANKLGIDAAIAYTIIGRVIQAGGGVISILFIAKYLTKVEQGFYYTFGSLLAIQIFFELGLSNVITQFVAHEVAHLRWENKTQLIGSDKSLSRLSSLLHFCIKWFSIISIILVFVLIILGYFFFNKYGKSDVDVNWHIPWLILSVSTSTSLMISPILAYFEGLGKVKEIALMRMVQQTVQLILLLLFLIFGLKLFASPLSAILSVFIIPFWFFSSSKKTLLKNIWQGQKEWKVNYKVEIFPFQWRIAISWISGYFIFQLFNPVLFARDGPVIAGQMGMTLTALNGVMSISMSWINTKVPTFANLVAKKDYSSLDLIFDKTIKQAISICGLILVLFAITIYTLQFYKISIGNRFLPIFPLTLLCIVTFVNQFIFAYAAYLRSHKKEPFLIQSIVMAVLTSLSTLLLGYYYGVNGITIGYCFLTVFVSFFWSRNIFTNKKEEWH